MLVAFVATTDLARARAFYETVLGLEVVEADDFAVVVDVHGTTLRVTAVPERAPAAYTVLGWQVDDLEAEVDELVGRGVTFLRFEGMDQDDRGFWTTRVASASPGSATPTATPCRSTRLHAPDRRATAQASPGFSGAGRRPSVRGRRRWVRRLSPSPPRRPGGRRRSRPPRAPCGTRATPDPSTSPASAASSRRTAGRSRRSPAGTPTR